MKKKFVRAVSAFMGLTMMFTAVPMLTGCGGGGKKDSIVIMTEELSGLFNPFYATSGTDMEVVGLTQIGMLTTKYKEIKDPVTGEVIKDPVTGEVMVARNTFMTEDIADKIVKAGITKVKISFLCRPIVPGRFLWKLLLPWRILSRKF